MFFTESHLAGKQAGTKAVESPLELVRIRLVEMNQVVAGQTVDLDLTTVELPQMPQTADSAARNRD